MFSSAFCSAFPRESDRSGGNLFLILFSNKLRGITTNALSKARCSALQTGPRLAGHRAVHLRCGIIRCAMLPPSFWFITAVKQVTNSNCFSNILLAMAPRPGTRKETRNTGGRGKGRSTNQAGRMQALRKRFAEDQVAKDGVPHEENITEVVNEQEHEVGDAPDPSTRGQLSLKNINRVPQTPEPSPVRKESRTRIRAPRPSERRGLLDSDDDMDAPITQNLVANTLSRDEDFHGARKRPLSKLAKNGTASSDSDISVPSKKRLRYSKEPSQSRERHKELHRPDGTNLLTPRSGGGAQNSQTLGVSGTNVTIGQTNPAWEDTADIGSGSGETVLLKDGPSNGSAPSQMPVLQRESNDDLSAAMAIMRTNIIEVLEGCQDAQDRDFRKFKRYVTGELQETRLTLQKLATSLQEYIHSQGTGVNQTGVFRTALAEWEGKLEQLTPHKKAVFTSLLFSRVLAFNVPLCVSGICEEVEVSAQDTSKLVLQCSEALATLLFSLQPRQSRDCLLSGIGKRHSDFKLAVVKNTFFNVQRDTFGIFLKEGADSSGGSGTPSEAHFSSNETVYMGKSTPKKDSAGWGRIKQPQWLKPGFVTMECILDARTSIEGKVPRRQSMKETPSKADIATFGAVKVSRMLISHLHDGRERVRAMFFQDVGFLLCEWSGLCTDADQTTVHMEWEDEGNDDIGDGELHQCLSDVPCTKVCRYGESSASVDAANQNLLDTLYKQCPQMILAVQHDVFVVTGEGGKTKQRKHSGGRKQHVRRLVHLLEVALNFCREYTEIEDTWAFLRSQEHALRCVFAVATVFRALVQSFLYSSDFAHRNIPDPSEVRAGSITLHQLLPGRVTRVSLMASRCIRLTESEYQNVNHPKDSVIVGSERGVEDMDVTYEQDIQASMAMGVAML